jgi:hypothetical protein
MVISEYCTVNHDRSRREILIVALDYANKLSESRGTYEHDRAMLDID